MCISCALCVQRSTDDIKSQWNGTFCHKMQCRNTLWPANYMTMSLYGDTSVFHCQFLLDLKLFVQTVGIMVEMFCRQLECG